MRKVEKRLKNEIFEISYSLLILLEVLAKYADSNCFLILLVLRYFLDSIVLLFVFHF